MALQSVLPFDSSPEPEWPPFPSSGDASPLDGHKARSAIAAPPVALSAPAAEIVYVRHPRAKRYVIRVVGDARVRVTIPRWGSKREAARFVEAQHLWIDQQLRAARATREQRAGEPRLPARSVEEDLNMRRAAARELPERLHELAARFALDVTKVSVRNQRWRWGSCSPTGHICLNWRLVEMPAFVRDYVLIHELMHLKRLDHSPGFWKLVSAACPEYQTARRWLREHERNVAID